MYVSVAMTIEYTEPSRELVGFLATAITCCSCQPLRTQPTAHKVGYCYLGADFTVSGVRGKRGLEGRVEDELDCDGRVLKGETHAYVAWHSQSYQLERFYVDCGKYLDSR
jgi:hypothetical protein